MTTSNIYDFAIVGAGMAGASLGYQLGRAGAKAVVLEREAQPGYHSTGRSAAMFMETYGTPHTRALTKASRDFYVSPPPGFADHPILTPRGVLYVAQDGQEAMLDQAASAYASEGLEVERLDPEQARAMVPCLKPDHLVGAILDRHASDMDVDTLHQGYLRGMRKDGVVLQCNADVASARRKDGLWQIELRSGETILARVIVDAAGAWADAVAEASGVSPLGIQPKRRAAFLFDAPEGVDIRAWPTVLGVDESYYFKPDAGVLLGSPANADPVPPQDVQPEELDIATGIYRITEATDLQIRRPRNTWAGLRSFAPDGEFVIGWDDAAEGFFWLAGQGGYGIQTAAGAAELAAALLLRRPVPERMTKLGVSPPIVDPARLR